MSAQLCIFKLAVRRIGAWMFSDVTMMFSDVIVFLGMVPILAAHVGELLSLVAPFVDAVVVLIVAPTGVDSVSVVVGAASFAFDDGVVVSGISAEADTFLFLNLYMVCLVSKVASRLSTLNYYE